MKKAKKIDGNILRLLAIFVIILAVSGITKGTSFLNVCLLYTSQRNPERTC